METVRTQIENFITNGDLQSAIYKLIEHVSTPSDSNYLCTLWGELTRTELDRSLIDYEDYNRTKNRITKSLLAFLAQLELKETAISVKKGYAVHNIPSSLVLGKKILCEVKISDEQIETVKTKFKRILNDVYLRDDMEVKLTSDDGAFTIEPLNSLTLQSIISGEINSWKFWLTGNKDGKHVLVMTITGINKDVFSKSNKREDVTVVKIAVTMSREQNLVPEIAPPIYQPTNIYYGYVSSTQNVFVYVVKSGVAQIAIIVGVVLLVGIPGFQRAFFNNRLADEKEIVLPIDDIGQSTIEIVGSEQARIEQDAENQHILVIKSDVDNFTGFAIVKSISKSQDELFEVNIKGIKSGNPVLAYKLIDSSHALLLLKLTDNCVFHKPNVMIGNDRYLNWKLIDEQTIFL